ncbi:MAG: response regulator [Proteobacteria bacterium]|nr:response regulator [Pseudomonadota bacterium]MBU1387611.1 response regulator [Pseudomonadota bacterium]MBU1544202.1 response regulator [Pseudomonadota bacterium]MBU2430003.1 response regulator [Pseudomonadota bacterium]
MKKYVIIILFSVLWMSTGHARDFIVEYVEENYNETQAQFSYDPLIYHSIQVNSDAGPKVLILQGNDYHYRNWLRHYIAQDKKFIAQIADDRVDEFITSSAYKMDVTSLHPFNGNKWENSRLKQSRDMDVQGDNNILIVDPNEKRSHLAQMIIKKMGYGVILFSSAQAALNVFELQPEKFKMVIANHAVPDMALEDFVDRIVKADHTKPVIIDVGYHEPQIKDLLSTRFSGLRSVHLKQVILRELSKAIVNLMKESA